jgi:Leucine-rich repeat (LRR) protein
MTYQPHFANGYPYLGAVPGEIACNDVAQLPSDATVVRITKPYKNIAQLGHFRQIRQLDISRLEDDWLPYLQNLPNLEHLRVSYCKKQKALPRLTGLESLRVLIVLRCRQLQSLDFVGDLAQLEALCISEIKHVTDLSPLESLVHLKELWADGFQVNDLNWISPLSSLQSVHLLVQVHRKNRSLQPLHPLHQLTHFFTIDQYSKQEYQGLLVQVPSLKDITFSGNNRWTLNDQGQLWDGVNT